MTVISDQAPPGQDYILRRLADLERQVRELSAARGLEAATIKGGSLRVVDDTGALKVLVGLLPDGTYGLAAVNPAGELVSLSTLAFGMKADQRSGPFTPTTGLYESLGGPVVTTQIGSSGRALFLITGTANCDTFSGEGIHLAVMGTGPAGAVYGPSIGYSLWNTIEATNVGGTLSMGSGVADFANDLAPGEWTFEVQFRTLGGANPDATQASLTVMPF